MASSTIRDVAERAGVSISTVSRALNNTAPVSAEKKRRIAEAVSELSYVPNPAARSLLNQSTGGIGVLLPFVGGEFFADLLSGMDLATQKHGYFLMISSSHRSRAEFLAALKGLDKRVDGMLIMATEMEAEELTGLLPADAPCVFVNSRVSSDRFDAINFDNFGGMYQVTSHLLRQGHRRIAIIRGPDSAFDAQERLDGYRAALQAFGLRHDSSLEFEGDFTQEAGYQSALAVLQSGVRPTAIIGSNDYCAMGVLKMLREQGLRVPQDVSVSGFDDISSARFTSPPLTTLRVPLEEIGTMAVERLIDRVHGRDPIGSRRLRLPVDLIVRESTAPVES